jgi:DNA-binding MarR family transcriptional regulator
VSENTGDEAARRFATALARLDGLRRHQQQYDDLGAADMRLLWLLRESGPQTLSEIGAALGLERSTVNRQVNAAVTAGLLLKERVPGSSAHRVQISPAGQEAFERGARAVLASITEVFADLGPDATDSLIALTERFVDAYARGGQPVPRA